ncbi:AAA family ATPase [Streptomyces sp. 3MP-14]|uniref:AAA family ATPase n=1 Tax=Streptomyces mimosae TaxID=2586635 RepID=A0A5N5ZV39_9ACTN|nr:MULTISPECIES: LuxR family transcriptional regulator [Streptomyces]KAB8159586.1 AAA family ATPase [Streptomyces mimosae]KAB8172864.1 AAA family ATPase [Streptomyces sp. 3MP-14]
MCLPDFPRNSRGVYRRQRTWPPFTDALGDDLNVADRLQAPSLTTVRRAELCQLVEQLDGLRLRQSRIVDVVGDPGTGKSRLLSAFRRETQRRGTTTVSGCCSEAEQGIPLHAFGPLLDGHLFDGVIGEAGLCHTEIMPTSTRDSAADPTMTHQPDGTSGERSRYSAYTAVRYHIGRRVPASGMVLYLDDFHWADPCSAEFVDYLMRWPLDVPLLVVIARRPRQSSAPLRNSLSEGIANGSATQLQLGPLSLEQSAEVLGVERTDWRVERLHRVGGGNPLYLQALWDSAGNTDLGSLCAETDPTSVDGATGVSLPLSEINTLPADDWSVTAATVLLGDNADRSSIARVSGLHPLRVSAAINRLSRRDLLRPMAGGAGVRLRHPALRTLLYPHINQEWRTRAHRVTARVLAERGAPPQDLATHLEFAIDQGDPGGAEVLVRGAREVAYSNPAKAARWLKRALPHLHRPPAAGPGPVGGPEATGTPVMEVSTLLARVLGMSGQLAESRRLSHAVLLVLPHSEAALQASNAAFCALMDCQLGHYTEARAMLKARSDNPRPIPFAEAVDVRVAELFIHLLSGRRDLGAPDPLPKPSATESGDALSMAGAHAVRALRAVLLERPLAALRALDEGAAAFDGLSDATLRRRPEYLVLLAATELQADHHPEAKRHFERAAGILRASGQRHLLPMALAGLASACARAGTPRELREAVNGTRAAAWQIGSKPLGAAADALEEAYGRLAEHDHWADAIHTPEDTAAVPPPMAFPWRADRVIRAVGLPGGAALSERQLTLAFTKPWGGSELPLLPKPSRPAYIEMLLNAVVISGGDKRTGVCWTSPLEGGLRRLLESSGLAYTTAVRAHVLRAQGGFTAAASLYRVAAELFGVAGLHQDQRRMVVLAESCRARENPALPRSNAVPEVEPPQETDTDHEALRSLTAREREVAQLAGVGLRTKEIAERLNLSPRTVSVHLTHIYQKTQVRSRTELVRMMARVERAVGVRDAEPSG